MKVCIINIKNNASFQYHKKNEKAKDKESAKKNLIFFCKICHRLIIHFCFNILPSKTENYYCTIKKSNT